MNKIPRSNSNRNSGFTLGDLILAVASESRNIREATLALNDLLSSGRVSLSRNLKRAGR